MTGLTEVFSEMVEHFLICMWLNSVLKFENESLLHAQQLDLHVGQGYVGLLASGGMDSIEVNFHFGSNTSVVFNT